MTIEGNIITASEGMVLTNGENFATAARLGDWDSPDNRHEVTVAEYEAVMADRDAQQPDMGLM